MIQLHKIQVEFIKQIDKRYVMLFSFTAAICSIIYLISFFVNNSAVEVNTVKLTKAEIKSTVSCSGTIQSVNTNNVYYSIPLKTDRVRVKIGDTVKAGQTLIDVDTAETVQAFSNLNQKNSTTSTQQTDLSSISSLVNQNQSNISISDYNTLSQNYQSQIANGDNNSTSNNISDYTSNQSVDSNNINYPEIPSFVKAPISGVVTCVNVSVGDFSNPSVPVVSVADLKNLQVKAQVDEFLINLVKIGQPVIIKGNGFASVYSGVITQIYPIARQIITGTGTRTVVDVIITIANPESDLKPGLTANVDIIIADNKQACTAPYEAINEDDNNNEYVYVCKNDRVYKTYIKTGKEYDNCVEIVSGLKIGDFIVVNPPQQFNNGKRILQVKASYNPQPSS
jgi:HlyD family secretion protein